MRTCILLFLIPTIVNSFVNLRFFISSKNSIRRCSLNSVPRRDLYRNYPLSRNYHEKYIKRLNHQRIENGYNASRFSNFELDITDRINTKNNTMHHNDILGIDDNDFSGEDMIFSLINTVDNNNNSENFGYSVIINKDLLKKMSIELDENFNSGLENQRPLYKYNEEEDDETYNSSEYFDIYGNKLRTYGKKQGRKKSENFEVIRKSPYNFSSVGGYDKIKSELYQCIDILSNYKKYKSYNVRTPKGLIFEGPPGNGKTLLAKALAGEANISFIPVSGSEFQDKYVGVGSGRVRELFQLARDNTPCIIFIDEIDALGRQRSKDGDSSGNERDATLNELLIALDGFKDSTGVFVIGATNRADLLDTALVRPGRIDKRIYISNPDSKTRGEILKIHSKGKPYDHTVILEDLVDFTNGFSGAQIENLLNEAMLNALRVDRQKFTSEDLDEVLNKVIGGWQPAEHSLTKEMIDQIAIHELGHAIVGLLCENHSKMIKVVINLSSPTMPAYTIFENTNNVLSKREALVEHLMILLAGRIAEEVFYGISVTTGAINDFEEAQKLAQRMICYYGMGKQLIYPNLSEKFKEMIDTEVASLIHEAYGNADYIIRNSKDLIAEGAEILKRDNVLRAETLVDLLKKREHNLFLSKRVFGNK